jgi:hypothetical protein
VQVIERLIGWVAGAVAGEVDDVVGPHQARACIASSISRRMGSDLSIHPL